MALQSTSRTGCRRQDRSGCNVTRSLTIFYLINFASSPFCSAAPVISGEWLHFSENGKKVDLSVGRAGDHTGSGNLLYAKFDNGTEFKFESGIAQADLYGIGNGKLFKVGMDVGVAGTGAFGGVIRTSLAETTVHAGPLDINVAAGVLDSGVKWNRGLEVKALGFGDRGGYSVLRRKWIGAVPSSDKLTCVLFHIPTKVCVAIGCAALLSGYGKAHKSTCRNLQQLQSLFVVTQNIPLEILLFIVLCLLL